jgi:hypothetical protein
MQTNLRRVTMKKYKILTNPTRVTDLNFEEMYDDFSGDWELKAERLQTRRWNRIREEMA